MLQRIKSALEVTGRTCSNVSGTSWQWREEDVTTYQERVVENADLRTLLPPWTPPKIKIVRDVTWRRCYNQSRASWKWLEEHVPTYQERLGNYVKKMLQRIRNVLLRTQKKERYYTPPTSPKKDTQCAKVTTVPPLHGRRHQKHVPKTGWCHAFIHSSLVGSDGATSSEVRSSGWREYAAWPDFGSDSGADCWVRCGISYLRHARASRGFELNQNCTSGPEPPQNPSTQMWSTYSGICAHRMQATVFKWDRAGIQDDACLHSDAPNFSVEVGSLGHTHFAFCAHRMQRPMDDLLRHQDPGWSHWHLSLRAYPANIVRLGSCNML